MSIDRPWYTEGLRFACTQCGHCCRIEGHVWVDEAEIGALARHLGLDLDSFGGRFLRRIGRRYSLIERANHDCIFWEDGCTVYSARPRQCRTFPFWEKSLENASFWQRTSERCEGVGQGRLYTLSKIQDLRRGRGATDDGRLEEPRSA